MSNEFVGSPGLAGTATTVLGGRESVDLKLVSRLEFGSGAVWRCGMSREGSHRGLLARVGRIICHKAESSRYLPLLIVQDA